MSDVLVLCYHAISDSWPDPLTVTSEGLRGQLRWLLRRGYRGATFGQAMTAPPARLTLVVTFDDGFGSVAELAYPILSQLGLPGTVFAVSDFCDGVRPLSWAGLEQWQGGPFEHELRCMDWQRLAQLAEAGWEIGSHTLSHPRLTQADDAALSRELLGSRLACEAALGGPCHSLAYPYGDVDTRVIAAARAAGYQSAAGLPARPAGRAAMDWPRICVYRSDSLRHFRLKTDASIRRLRRIIRQSAAPVRS